MIELKIDPRDLQRLSDELGATPDIARRAMNSTLRKMASWVRSRSTRELARELNIQPKILRGRMNSIKLRQSGGSSSITLWYGLNPISLIRLKARQNGRGVAAYGGRFVKSAFIAHARGADHVFLRKTRKRTPLQRQVVEIMEPAHDYLEKLLDESAEFEARFFRIFEHELQWRTRTR